MRISEYCYAVTGLAYTLPWVVNAGFIVGEDETLIVDTGANAMAAATIHGYATAVRPENRLRVVNTEKHFDHIGGNGFFQELGIPIHGQVGIARTAAEFAEERAGFHPAFHYATPLANPTVGIAGDQSFELGSCTVDVLLTPGHTPTNIALFERKDRVLYCGDCLTNLYAPNLDAASGVADWRLWMASLDRIDSLSPEVIVCGHGPIVQGEDIVQVIQNVRTALRQRVEAAGFTSSFQS